MMNIDEMEAGRELDVLIARNVTHVEVVEFPPGMIDGIVPFYSTNITAAWQVVEKLRDADFWWSASYKTWPGKKDAGYETKFRCVRAGIRGDHFATAPDLPLAICRAALKAVQETT